MIGLVMGQGARPLAVACAVGLVLALVVPALVASYIPACRALRINPNDGLRSE